MIRSPLDGAVFLSIAYIDHQVESEFKMYLGFNFSMKFLLRPAILLVGLDILRLRLERQFHLQNDHVLC